MIPDLSHRVAQQLCDRGILRKGEEKVLWIFTRRVYPELDGSWEDAIRVRMASAMFSSGTIPDTRTAALISLAQQAALLKPNFAAEQLKLHADHIQSIQAADLLAVGATRQAIQAAEATMLMLSTTTVLDG